MDTYRHDCWPSNRGIPGDFFELLSDSGLPSFHGHGFVAIGDSHRPLSQRPTISTFAMAKKLSSESSDVPCLVGVVTWIVPIVGNTNGIQKG